MTGCSSRRRIADPHTPVLGTTGGHLQQPGEHLRIRQHRREAFSIGDGGAAHGDACDGRASVGHFAFVHYEDTKLCQCSASDLFVSPSARFGRTGSAGAGLRRSGAGGDGATVIPPDGAAQDLHLRLPQPRAIEPTPRA